MTWSRRGFAALLPTILASLSLRADEQGRLPSKIYLFQGLPVRRSDKLEFRPIVSGKTVDGCRIAVHESKLGPKSEPHPPHHHNGEEIFLMLEGMLDVTINGQVSRISRGSVAFVGSGDEHGIRNPGDTPARYYVVEFGPQR